MTAAIYARKSTEQNGISDESKSVARQVEHARAYAASNGWTVLDECVYIDDGISGAEFARRPGLMRLLNALTPLPSFDVLILSELSRLGREQLETGYALKQLSQARVRVFTYQERKEIVLDTPTDKFLMSAMNFASEIEREKARQRVADAVQRKARAGHACGGAVFGYSNTVVMAPDGRRSHVMRKVNHAEAEIVRRIFALCAAGKGVKAIAKLLNAEHVPSPRPQQGRPRTWSRSSVRAVLYRELCRGELVWNKTRQSDVWGQRIRESRPESEWIHTTLPEMRIVSDDEWAAFHRRLDSRSDSTSARRTGRCGAVHFPVSSPSISRAGSANVRAAAPR
jgi:site-specific DNA recombinase